MRVLEAKLAERVSHLANRTMRLLAGIALLIALTFGLYYPALHAQLVADDFSLVGQLSFPDAIAYFGKTFGFGRNEYRPVTALSYAVDRALWDSDAQGYHLTNLLLHAMAAVLLFLFLKRLTANFPLALLAGCLFVIGPINSSRIIWISARDGSICAVFSLGALWLFVFSRQQNTRTLHGIAVGLCACALLAYEGAVILPILLFAVELIFFTSGSLRLRLVSSVRATVSFWILLAGYLAFWWIMFSGSIGGYDLSLRPVAILENYARLLSTLFYGGKHVAFGLAYVALLVSSYRILRAQRLLTAIAIVVILIAFLPYCFMNGFAYRFGYFSALGISILLAVCIVGSIRGTGRWRHAIGICAGVLFCAYYAVQDRNILSDWTTAGEIAARIPQSLRELHPNLPERAVLVFTGIPRVQGKASVFPTGLDAAIQNEYPVKVLVQQYDLLPADLPERASGGAFIFAYRGGRDPLREIRPVPR
jgi:hypothetical protein